jgi:hypothetical protein
MTAITAMALESAGVEDAAFVQAEAKAIRKNAALDADLARIGARLEQAGIWYMPLKGALLKDWYPRYGMRQMADYDVLFDAPRTDEVRAILESFGYTVEHYGEDHHDLYRKAPFYVFEMHRRLFNAVAVTLPLVRYYENVRERLLPTEGHPYRLRFTDEDFYLFLLAHEYKHYATSGIGLRANLDLYVFWRRFGDTLDRAYLARELETLGITDFERESRELAFALFGDGTLTDAGRAILENHLLAGTYGSEAHRVDRAVTGLGGGFGGRLRYVLSRLVIPRETIQEVFPFFWKHKILLPLLPPFRMVRGAILHGPRVRAELRALLRRRR